MKNNKTVCIVLIIIIILCFGFCLLYPKNKNVVLESNIVTQPNNTPVEYNNTDYGFTFSLPENWRGYSIVKDTWEGNSLKENTITEAGPTLLIRNPKWTESLHYEDIPIAIFTIEQWEQYTTEKFHIGAAPVLATELARNNFYVFALPPRWDFDYSQGYEEAGNILKNNPIKTFNIDKISTTKDGRQCYSYFHEATKDEPYTTSEFIDVTIKGKEIKGTKNGAQKGPDMTNSYTGTLLGTVSEDIIDVLFSYVIDGSSNKGKERYVIRDDQTGLEKLRYPLIEKGGILVPDTTKPFKTLLYSRVECEASN